MLFVFCTHTTHTNGRHLQKKKFRGKIWDAVPFKNKDKFSVQCCAVKLQCMWDFSNSWIFRIALSYFKIQIGFPKILLSSFLNINPFWLWWFSDDSHLKQFCLYMGDSLSLVKMLPGFVINSTVSQIKLSKKVGPARKLPCLLKFTGSVWTMNVFWMIPIFSKLIHPKHPN